MFTHDVSFFDKGIEYGGEGQENRTGAGTIESLPIISARCGGKQWSLAINRTLDMIYIDFEIITVLRGIGDGAKK